MYEFGGSVHALATGKSTTQSVHWNSSVHWSSPQNTTRKSTTGKPYWRWHIWILIKKPYSIFNERILKKKKINPVKQWKAIWEKKFQNTYSKPLHMKSNFNKITYSGWIETKECSIPNCMRLFWEIEIMHSLFFIFHWKIIAQKQPKLVNARIKCQRNSFVSVVRSMEIKKK